MIKLHSYVLQFLMAIPVAKRSQHHILSLAVQGTYRARFSAAVLICRASAERWISASSASSHATSIEC